MVAVENLQALCRTKEVSRTVPLNNVIDVHMARIRRKVDADQQRQLIHTVRGLGFVLKEEDR